MYAAFLTRAMAEWREVRVRLRVPIVRVLCLSLAVALALALVCLTASGCGQSRGSTSGAASSAAKVWALGAFGFVLASSDGGQSWRQQSFSERLQIPRAITFADAAHGWIVGLGGIGRTDDGGATWSVVSVDDIKRRIGSTAGFTLLDVDAADADRAWAVGHKGSGDESRALVLATNDGGLSWREQELDVPVTLTGVCFVDAHRGWVVGATVPDGTGFVFATEDGGHTWAEQLRLPDSGLSAVAFADASHGWVVANGRATRTRGGGAILATRDGGATWTPQLEGSGSLLQALACVDAEHVWAVGTDGAVLATSDGGASWVPQQSGTSARLDAVAFADEGRGWAVGPLGDEPVSIHTADGGVTWSSVGFSGADHPGAILIDVCTIGREGLPAAGRAGE